MRKVVCRFALSLSLPLFADVGLELIPNGDFSKLDESGWCAEWPKGRGARIASDSNGRRLVLDGGNAQVNFDIPLKPEWGQLKLSTQMKVTDATIGAESWSTARIAMCFMDSAGQRVGAWPDVFAFLGTTDWQPCERVYAIPAGATRLSLCPCNLGASGTVEFKALSLKVSRVRATRPANAPLPDGAPQDIWGLGDAWRQTTPTREKISMNGLWGFRPVLTNEAVALPPAPDDCWGWCKVPAIWPHKWEGDRAPQPLRLAPWLEENVEDAAVFDQAWYKRKITVPRSFEGKRVVLEFTMLQTHAKAFVDGAEAGEVWYPGGELDLTKALTPGKEQEIALLVTARPFSAISQAFMAPDRIIEKKASVKLRGITGDLYLTATPPGARLDDVQIVTALDNSVVTFVADVANLTTPPYRLRAVITGGGGGESRTLDSRDLPPWPDGTMRFPVVIKGLKRWDTHTPQNLHTVTLSLLDGSGNVLDTLTPVTFGFREFRITGRDFLLNGTPIHLRALHNSTMNAAADKACKPAALEHIRRLKQYGFNFIIAGNYDFEAGATGYLDGLLEACDETGMLLAFSLPHIKDFNYALENPEFAERYREQARWLIRRARNHPSVILYAMNHNSCGYYGDQNPLKIDGVFEPPDKSGKQGAWWENNRRQSRIAADIAAALDPTRPIYHHQSGNLGPMHTVNIYLNWAPRQERSDWLEHWSAVGQKPLFFVEWGPPHISSWSSYRGPKFIWSSPALQSLWASEYAAQFWGDAAYRPTPEAHAALDNEEKLWARGHEFNWWELNQPLKHLTNNYQNVQGYFMDDNWRSHRAWGISAMLPWDQGDAWTRVEKSKSTEVEKLKSLEIEKLKSLEVEKPRNGEVATSKLLDSSTSKLLNFSTSQLLKFPGIVPDNLCPDGQFVNDTGDPSAFTPTAYGNSLLRWNMPDCAFIGGADTFTDKTHHYPPSASAAKTLVILNDRRTPQTVNWTCTLTATNKTLKKLTGSVTVPIGGQARVPVTFTLPKAPGDYTLNATFAFQGGVRQTDTLPLRVIPFSPPSPLDLVLPDLPLSGFSDRPHVLLYDTKGITSKHFDRLGVRYTLFKTDQELEDWYNLVSRIERAFSFPYVLVIGRESLSEVSAKCLWWLREDVHRLVMEQSSKQLTELLGFRIAERGSRLLFPRFTHPITKGLDTEHFRDWTGASTLLPEYLTDLDDLEVHDPQWQWCGQTSTRVWRCGNRNSVASVLIEKPAVGDWRALIDGEFDLQYSPLLEYTDGTRRTIFCQLDVSGRTAPDPVADMLTLRILNQLLFVNSQLSIKMPRPCTILGDNAQQLCASHALIEQVAQDHLITTNSLIIASSGAEIPNGLHQQIFGGANVLCLGMNAEEIAKWSPVPIGGVTYTNAHFTRIEDIPPELNGLSNADWAWHGKMGFWAFPMAPDGNQALRVVRHGKGVIVFWQVPPWQIDEEKHPYLRTTKRRANAMAARLLANLGGTPSGIPQTLYLDTPENVDDPYRYYRW